MRAPFVPQNFIPPKYKRINKEFCVEPITINHNKEDQQIFTKNAEIILKIRGFGSRKGWPFIFTLEENYKDLAWLELCAKEKQLFSYVIRDKNKKYVGCVYIYPIELYYPEKAEKYDVDFSFWITQSIYNQGLYELIFSLLISWLKKDWPFDLKRIYLRNKEIPANIK